MAKHFNLNPFIYFVLVIIDYFLFQYNLLINLYLINFLKYLLKHLKVASNKIFVIN